MGNPRQRRMKRKVNQKRLDEFKRLGPTPEERFLLGHHLMKPEEVDHYPRAKALGLLLNTKTGLPAVTPEQRQKENAESEKGVKFDVVGGEEPEEGTKFDVVKGEEPKKAPPKKTVAKKPASKKSTKKAPAKKKTDDKS